MADRRGYTSLYQNIPVQPLSGYSDPSAFIRVREAVRGLEDQVTQIRGLVGNSVPGYVSSVGLTAPTIFSVTGSPVTDTGTIALSLVSQTARSVFAAPTATAGTPSFRALEAADIQSGVFGITRGGTGLSSTPTNGQLLIGNGSGYTLATLTAGTGITVTNGMGSITVTNSLPGFLNPMTTLGDIIYGGAAGAATRLGGETTTTRKFLRSVGVAGAATAPAWDTVTKTDVGLSNVENTALSTWAGSTNLTTLGTVTTGTWSATSIAPAKGGTGLTTAPAQDVIVYGGGSLSFSTLAPPSSGTNVLTWTSGIGITWTTKQVGTVTSVGMTVPTGLSVTPASITTSGTFAVTYTAGYSIPTTASQTNWDTAYNDRLKWDGGSSGLTAATGRTSLGATTVGSNLFTLTNPSAVTFLRINADNSVSTLDAATFRTAIGAGTGSGTVTSVTASSPLASSGGTTPNISLGTVGVANGGTGLTSFTAGQILYASATTTIAGLSVTTGGLLYGGATAPAYTAIADLNWDNTNKRLGISQASPSYKLTMLDNNSALSTSNRVVSISSTISNTVSNGNTQYGIYSFLSVGNNIAGTPNGIYSIVDKSGGANLADINAISSQATMNSMGITVTNAAGFRAVSPTVTMGTFTNAYGLYIESQDVTNVGTGYGIYQASAADVNYYGGRVFLNTTDGTTDPNARLLVRDDVGGATGMVVRNNDTGTSSLAFFALNTSTTGLVAYSFGSGYTTSGLFEGNGTALVSGKTNGLNIGATNAAGLLKFYTGGSASGNERMRIASNGNVTVDTNVLFVDALNNRVGVNMTPTVALDVTGAAAVSGALTLTTTDLGYTTSGLQLRSSVPGASASTDYFFHRGADTTVMDRIVVHTPSTSAGMGFAHMTSGGVTRFFSDGNTGNFTVDGGTLFVDAVNNEVGIGTTAPGQRLEVAGTIIVTGNSDMPASAGTNVRITGGYASPDIGRIFVGDGSGWKLHFSSRTASTNTDRVTFTDAGRVGIGATTPGVRLDVSETLAVATSSTFSAAAIRMNPVYTATGTITVKHRYLHFTQPTISGGTTTFTDAHTMYFDAAAGTHRAVDAGTTKTTPGTVNAWVKIDINGTTYYIPAYTSKTA